MSLHLLFFIYRLCICCLCICYLLFTAFVLTVCSFTAFSLILYVHVTRTIILIIKKPSSLILFKDESLCFVLPPCFIPFSQKEPLQVRTSGLLVIGRYSGAVMGAPIVASGECLFRYAAPRLFFHHTFCASSQQTEALCGIHYSVLFSSLPLINKFLL